MTRGIDPETYLQRVLFIKHQTIETQVSQGALDVGADYSSNRNAMIEQGLIKAEQSKIFWQSAPLPKDAVAVGQALFADKALVGRLHSVLAGVGEALKKQPDLLPAHYTSFTVAQALLAPGSPTKSLG